MHRLDHGQLEIHARVIGHYQGTWFVWDDPPNVHSQYIWPNGDPSSFWWGDGNMSCDCNRSFYLDDGPDECGEQIRLLAVIPLEGEHLPLLLLPECPLTTVPPHIWEILEAALHQHPVVLYGDSYLLEPTVALLTHRVPTVQWRFYEDLAYEKGQ